ncbi:MAG TPA: hypothetical protein VG711_08170 [Phycisphaerales bacterium]|nr:hypothetical protein [Phycisphaerales bacterium]
MLDRLLTFTILLQQTVAQMSPASRPLEPPDEGRLLDFTASEALLIGMGVVMTIAIVVVFVKLVRASANDEEIDEGGA